MALGFVGGIVLVVESDPPGSPKDAVLAALIGAAGLPAAVYLVLIAGRDLLRRARGRRFDLAPQVQEPRHHHLSARRVGELPSKLP